MKTRLAPAQDLQVPSRKLMVHSTPIASSVDPRRPGMAIRGSFADYHVGRVHRVPGSTLVSAGRKAAWCLFALQPAATFED